MAFQFPASPTLNQLFTPIAGITYQFDGTGWAPYNTQFETIGHASATYLSIANAASTYLSLASAAATYVPLAGGVTITPGGLIVAPSGGNVTAVTGTGTGTGSGVIGWNPGATISGALGTQAGYSFQGNGPGNALRWESQDTSGTTVGFRNGSGTDLNAIFARYQAGSIAYPGYVAIRTTAGTVYLQWALATSPAGAGIFSFTVPVAISSPLGFSCQAYTTAGGGVWMANLYSVSGTTVNAYTTAGSTQFIMMILNN